MSKRLYFFPSFRQTEKSFNFEQLMPFAYSCQHWRHKSLDVYAKYLLSRSWLDSKAKSFTQTADSWWFTKHRYRILPREKASESTISRVFFPFLQNSIIFQSLNVVQEDIIISKTVPVTWLEIVEIIAFWRWVPFQEGPILYVKVMFEEESLLKWIEIE